MQQPALAPQPGQAAPAQAQPSAQPQQAPAPALVQPGQPAGGVPAARQSRGGQFGVPGAPLANPGPQAPITTQDRAGSIDDVRRERREERRGNQVFIREGDRTITREGGRFIIRHDEADRFRVNARDVRSERRGNEMVTIVERPDGSRIITVMDENGRLLRRIRREPEGREIVIINNRYDDRSRRGPGGFAFVELPPPVIRIPREQYIVEAEHAPPEVIYSTLMAPPVERITRAYTLEEIRYSPRLRDRMPRVDIDTVTFATGSWEVTPDQVQRLAPIAEGIKQAIQRNPSEVFLIEGYTDAVGPDVDNLSLSDRRAESVAIVLTEQFQVPAENLTTQGYGEQQLKVPTQAAERRNRRVTMRRITPLLAGGQPGGQPN